MIAASRANKLNCHHHDHPCPAIIYSFRQQSTYSRSTIIILDHWRFLSIKYQDHHEPLSLRVAGHAVAVAAYILFLYCRLYLIRDPLVDLTLGCIKSLLPLSHQKIGYYTRTSMLILRFKASDLQARLGFVWGGSGLTGDQSTEWTLCGRNG